MRNYSIMLAATLVAAAGAVAAAHAGYVVLGFALFVLAATPLPAAMAYRVHDAGARLIEARRSRRRPEPA